MNILLADDHRILRTGLKLLLASQDDCKVVAEASNGQEVLDILEETDVDVVLLDLSMPVMNGIDCLREIRRRHYEVKVLVLTMYSEQEYVTELMQLGADGYLCKDTLDAELFKGLRAVASGERYLSEREARSLLNGVLAEKKRYADPVGTGAGSPRRLSTRPFAVVYRGYAAPFGKDRVDV